MKARKNRITGTKVQVIRADLAGLDPAGGAWVTVCHDHGNLANHTTRKLAVWHATVPSWCHDCAVKHFGHSPDNSWA